MGRRGSRAEQIVSKLRGTDVLLRKGSESAHRTLADYYNTARPHSSLGYKSPALQAISIYEPASAALRLAQIV